MYKALERRKGDVAVEFQRMGGGGVKGQHTRQIGAAGDRTGVDVDIFVAEYPSEKCWHRIGVGLAAPRDDVQPAGQSSYPSKGDSTATFARAFDKTFIVNNLPYAQKIEFGHSTVAPQGVARIAILNVEQEFAGVRPLPNMPVR